MNWTLVAGRKSVQPTTKDDFRWYLRERKEKNSFDVVVCIPKRYCIEVNWTRGSKVAVVSQRQDSEILFAMIEHPQGLRLSYGGGKSSDAFLRWSKTYSLDGSRANASELEAFIGGLILTPAAFGVNRFCQDGWPLITPDKAIIFASCKVIRKVQQ